MGYTFIFDGTFCAADEAGRIGVFTSNATGAIPRVLLERWEALRRDRYPLPILMAALDVGHDPAPILDFGGSFRPDEAAPARRELLESPGDHGYYIYAENSEPFEEAVEEGLAARLPSSQGIVAIFREMPREFAQKLAASPELMGVVRRPAGESGRAFPPFGLASIGIFVYEHLCDDWATGPYGRIAYPSSALLVERLDAGTQALFEYVRLAGVDFERDQYVQPCESMPCATPFPDYRRADFRESVRNPGVQPSRPQPVQNMGLGRDLLEPVGNPLVQLLRHVPDLDAERRYDVTPSWWHGLEATAPIRDEAELLVQGSIPEGAAHALGMSAELFFDLPPGHPMSEEAARKLQSDLRTKLEGLRP